MPFNKVKLVQYEVIGLLLKNEIVFLMSYLQTINRFIFKKKYISYESKI